MTEIQITIQLPDQVESMEQLEAVIDAKGQTDQATTSILDSAAESSRRGYCLSRVQKKEPSSKVINRVN